jgi:hypothetical protein
MDTKQSNDYVMIANAFLIFTLIMTAGFFLGFLTELGLEDGSMRPTVLYSVIFFSNLLFVPIAFALVILKKFSPVSVSNIVVGWLSVALPSLASIWPIHTLVLSEPVTDAQLGWVGIIICLTLTVWATVETMRFHILRDDQLHSSLHDGGHPVK